MTDASFSAGKLPPNLSTLNLSTCINLTPATLLQFGQLKNLRVLEAASSPRIVTEYGLRGLAAECPHLELIDFSGSQGVTTEGLVALTSNCKRLKWLSIAKAVEINEIGLCKALSHCRTLELLNLTGCPGVTIRVIREALLRSPRLMRFDISMCTRLSETLLSDEPTVLPIKHPVLESLFVSSNPALGHETIFQITGMFNLRSLLLSGSMTIRDADVASISLSCHSLQHVDLADCPNIGDAAVISLARNCSHLTTLVVEGCPNVQDSSIAVLLHTSHSLNLLNLSRCPFITDATIAVALEPGSCPSLQTLSVIDCKVRGATVIKTISIRPGLMILHHSVKNLKKVFV